MKLYNIVIIAFLNTICAKNVGPGRITGLSQDQFNLSQQAPPPPLNNDGSRNNMQRDGPPPPPPPLNDDGIRQNIQKDGSNGVLQEPPPPHKFQRQNIPLDMVGDEEKCTTDCLESGRPKKECLDNFQAGQIQGRGQEKGRVEGRGERVFGGQVTLQGQGEGRGERVFGGEGSARGSAQGEGRGERVSGGEGSGRG